MIALKIMFKLTKSSNAKEGFLYYLIIHQEKTYPIVTPHKIYINEWDKRRGTITTVQCNNSRKEQLDFIQRKIHNDTLFFNTIIQSGTFTIGDIIEKVKRRIRMPSLFEFMESLIITYKQHGKIRTSETYHSTLNSIKRFRKDKDIALSDIDYSFIASYINYLKDSGLQHNTIAFYVHRTRAVYNKATTLNLVEQQFPFKHLKTNFEKTIKRAIHPKQLKLLKSLDLKYPSSRSLARDIFLFSFYTRGMSFIDIAYLQKKDIKNGYLIYQRKKTGQKLFIHWEICMQQIANKHKSKASSPYLFPFIDLSKGETRKQYHNALTLINRNLKKLGKDIGLESPLTMYVARHSWATIAKHQGIPLSVISEGMGHNNERTTQIYLASLDYDTLDKANRKIIKLL